MNLMTIQKYIVEVAKNHPLVNEAFIGSIYDINSESDTKYGVLSVQAQSVQKYNNYVLYNLYIYYADRLTEDKKNVDNVQAEAVNVLVEILNYCKNYMDVDFTNYTINLFEQKFADETAGAYLNVSIQALDDVGSCNDTLAGITIDTQTITGINVLSNYYTKAQIDAMLADKQDKLIAGDGITIEGNVISATGGGGDTIWKKRYNGIANNDNTALTPPDYSFSTAADAQLAGIYDTVIGWGNKTVQDTSSVIQQSFIFGKGNESHNSYNVAIGFNNVFKGQRTDGYGRGLRDNGYSDMCIIGKQNWMPAEGGTVPARANRPVFVVGIGYGLIGINGIVQTYGGYLYIKGVNGWGGRELDGTSHLQGYLSGLDTRISNNTTAISGKQDTISAGDGIDITNNVVSVDNTVAKAADVYTKTETDSLLNNKQDTLSAGTGINITNNTVSCTVDISGKEDKAVEASFTNEITAADNTIFKATADVTTLDVTDTALTATYVIQFNTAATGNIEVTFSAGIKFTNIPEFSNNEHWEIAIRGGYAVFAKYELS